MSTRWTVALNSNRNVRTIIVVGETQSIHQAVVRAALTKLRLPKKTNVRIFLERTGQELSDDASFHEARSTSGNDLLLISSGEEFVGSTTESRPTNTVKTVILADHPIALRQLQSTAESLPGIFHAVGQPDLHPGNKHPIGAVFVSGGWIHPPLIGSDIGCGMAWYKLSLDASAVTADRGKKVAERLVGLERAWSTEADRAEWVRWETDESKVRSESLGTIGAGNHFAEIQVVGELSEPCDLHMNDVVLLVHSGSRGYGGDILKRHSASDSLEAGSDEARRYLEEHDRACEWAKANRDLIALRFIERLERLDLSEYASVRDMRAFVQSRQVVDILHNNMEQTGWTDGHKVWIHRKGAAPTRGPQTGDPLPLLPLPGSRATPTAILRPCDHHEDMRNALSVAHGAGRAMTRAKALQSLASKYGHNTSRLLVPQSGEGTWVVCEDRDLVWEEAPEAYKDVRAVAADLEAAGLVRVLGWCHPCVSYKVRR